MLVPLIVYFTILVFMELLKAVTLKIVFTVP